MSDGIGLAAAVAASALSALAFYAGSRHCRWDWLRPRGRAGSGLGLLLAALALALWIARLGTGAGLCALLACWSLAAMLLPALAALGGAPAPARRGGR